MGAVNADSAASALPISPAAGNNTFTVDGWTGGGTLSGGGGSDTVIATKNVANIERL